MQTWKNITVNLPGYNLKNALELLSGIDALSLSIFKKPDIENFEWFEETKEDLEYSALDIDALNVDLLVDVLDVIEELDKVVKGSGQSVSGNIGSFQVDGAVEGLNQDSQYNVFIEDEKLVFFRDVNGVIEIAFDSGSNVYLQTIVQGYEGVILIGDGDDSEIIINQSN